MSTRCHIIIEDPEFAYRGILYRHSDGYPNGPHGVLATLVPFVARFMNHRGWDPEYLAAQIIADQINGARAKRLSCIGSDNPLHYVTSREASELDKRRAEVDNDFLGFGISNEVHGDVEFIYHLTPEGLHVEHPNGDKLTLDQEAQAMFKGEIPERFK